MKVLVTGGTGTVGRRLVEELRQRNAEVRVLSRKIPADQELTKEVEFVAGDMLDPASMKNALRGVDKLFLLNPVTAEELTQSLITLGMAERAKVAHVTYLSVLSAEAYPEVPHFASKLAVERALRKGKIPHTILRPGFYFQNDLGLREAIIDGGIYPLPIGRKEISATDVRDIAAAAAITLTKDGHDGHTYDIASAQRMTGPSNAAVWGHMLHKDVRYIDSDLDQFEEQIRSDAEGWESYDMRMMFEAFHDGSFVAPQEQVERLAKLLQREPRSYEDFVTETAGDWLSECAR